MSGPERLAAIVTALEQLGLPHLVMGGHAVRFYGLSRNTNDVDLHISPDQWNDLPGRLTRTSLFGGGPVPEGPSWRPGAFRRFQIGTLSDGREEWLEFWRANHLLAPFPELVARSETGQYGGRAIRFLGLSDLIRSKETERASDWQDVSLLEEIRDERNLATAHRTSDFTTTLTELRSRKGFESLPADRLSADAIRTALAVTANPITAAFLTPLVPDAAPADRFHGMIGEVIAGPLLKVEPRSARHLGLVEAVRRLYKQEAIATDRADKEAARRDA